MQLRAPLLYTMTGQVLKDVAVGITGDRISCLLPIADAPHDPETIDLSHTILLPGFVNAHCHMDLSHLRGKVSYTGSFAEWIQKIVTLRRHPGKADVLAAARELLRSGVTAVMDHVGVDPALLDLPGNPLRKFMFLEVIGFTPEQAAAALTYQNNRATEARRQGVSAIPSPHATYSVHPAVFQNIVNSPSPSAKLSAPVAHPPLAEADRQPSPAGGEGVLSIHCAESAEEWEMFVEGRGKLWEFVNSRYTPPLGIRGGRGELPSNRNPSQPPLIPRGGGYNSPLHYLSQHSFIPRSPWLAVHCNTLTDDDIVLLKRSHATVVHCPRSHRYFNHPPFPLEKLRAAGVPVAIGTDSLASCPNFDFLEELRTLREEFPLLTTDEILMMATLHGVGGGARRVHHRRSRGATPDSRNNPDIRSRAASRWETARQDPQHHAHLGVIFPGAFADIIGLPLQNDLLEGPVAFSMIGGRRVI